METNLEMLANVHRREMLAGARQGRAAVQAHRAGKVRDPLRDLPRARMMWWIVAARLRRAATETLRGAR
jgi:hypothetical protein